MTRRPVAIGVALACAALLVLVLSNQVAAARREAAAAARVERDRRDRDAADRPLASPAERARRTLRLCPRGADTFARALARAARTPRLTRGEDLDPAALARLSQLTLRAERRAERVASGPALPQRMGRERAAGGWRPVAATATCAAIDLR